MLCSVVLFCCFLLCCAVVVLAVSGGLCCVLLFVFVSVLVSFYVCCFLYTPDAAYDLLCVDLGVRRIIKKKHNALS